MGIFDAILFPFIWFNSAILVGFEWVLTRLGMSDTSGWMWTLAIIGLVLTLRGLLTPLMLRQIKSQRRLQMVQPELLKIQQKYKGKKDPESQKKFQEETFGLYREAGANPFGACLPILIQMPFFFALFRLLNTAKGVSEGTSDPLGFFNRELATKMADSSIFDARMTSTFLYDEDMSAKILSLALIIVMCLTQFYTSHQLMRQNMPASALDSPMARQQQMLIYIMPIIFAISGVNFPLALLIYWTVSNFYTMAQQFFVIRNMPTPGSEAERKMEARMKAKGKEAKRIELKNPKLLEERAASTGATAVTQVPLNKSGKPSGQRAQPTRKKRSKKR